MPTSPGVALCPTGPANSQRSVEGGGIGKVWECRKRGREGAAGSRCAAPSTVDSSAGRSSKDWHKVLALSACAAISCAQCISGCTMQSFHPPPPPLSLHEQNIIGCDLGPYQGEVKYIADDLALECQGKAPSECNG